VSGTGFGLGSTRLEGTCAPPTTQINCFLLMLLSLFYMGS
jgi:hypothetical protein